MKELREEDDLDLGAIIRELEEEDEDEDDDDMKKKKTPMKIKKKWMNNLILLVSENLITRLTKAVVTTMKRQKLRNHLKASWC